MENEKKIFAEKSYEKFKNAIQDIANEEKVEDVYVLSFCFSCDNDDDRYPKITLGYNTNSNYSEEASMAGSKEEAKWDYAYWLQNELETIGGKEDALLQKWFEKAPYFYSEEENEKAMEDDEDLFEKILKKGDKFKKDFINETIAIAKQLFDNKVVEKVFGKNIPIIIHDEEYSEDIVKWTKKANTGKLIKGFLEYIDNDED